jgi:hypothetical protein
MLDAGAEKALGEIVPKRTSARTRIIRSMNPLKIPVDMRALISELNDIKKIMNDVMKSARQWLEIQ